MPIQITFVKGIVVLHRQLYGNVISERYAMRKNNDDKPIGQVKRVEGIFAPPSQLIPIGDTENEALSKAYAEMASDKEREAEALEWIEAFIGDVLLGDGEK